MWKSANLVIQFSPKVSSISISSILNFCIIAENKDDSGETFKYVVFFNTVATKPKSPTYLQDTCYVI